MKITEATAQDAQRAIKRLHPDIQRGVMLAAGVAAILHPADPEVQSFAGLANGYACAMAEFVAGHPTIFTADDK